MLILALALALPGQFSVAPAFRLSDPPAEALRIAQAPPRVGGYSARFTPAPSPAPRGGPAWYPLEYEPGVEAYGVLDRGMITGIIARRYATTPPRLWYTGLAPVYYGAPACVGGNCPR